jgi:hypothetical protein
MKCFSLSSNLIFKDVCFSSAVFKQKKKKKKLGSSLLQTSTWHYWEVSAKDWLFYEVTNSRLCKDTAERD